jgi:hypothetical protein
VASSTSEEAEDLEIILHHQNAWARRRGDLLGEGRRFLGWRRGRRQPGLGGAKVAASEHRELLQAALVPNWHLGAASLAEVLADVLPPAGEGDAEGGTASELAFHGHQAAVQLDGFLDEREADSGTAEAPRAAGVRLREAVEDDRQVRGSDARAGVGHPHVHVAGILRDPEDHLTGLGELERVGDEVLEDEIELLRVGVDHVHLLGALQLERDALLLGEDAEGDD